MGPQLVANGVTYFHKRDEDMFFAWLETMPCVHGFDGTGEGLLIQLTRQPTDDDLRELLGFFFRYGVDMGQLAQFANDKRAWFSAPSSYWHDLVFNGVPEGGTE
ncbi:MAG TPA: hypothetical protein VG248_00330 [Caulobacteraceae bacterium]|nr:hypothetical protein [Caulobacteraceae bacterium]